MTHATPSLNLMVQIGRVELSKFVKIASLVLLEAATAVAADLAADLAAVVGLVEEEEDLEDEAVDMEEAIVVMVVETVVAAIAVVLQQVPPAMSLSLQIHLRMVPPQVMRDRTLFMSAMLVTLASMVYSADNIKLPWSTSNDDLVELFTTIAKVERAEIQYEQNGRSRGTGVVQMDSVENAEVAICESLLQYESCLLLTFDS